MPYPIMPVLEIYDGFTASDLYLPLSFLIQLHVKGN